MKIHLRLTPNQSRHVVEALADNAKRGLETAADQARENGDIARADATCMAKSAIFGLKLADRIAAHVDHQIRVTSSG